MIRFKVLLNRDYSKGENMKFYLTSTPTKAYESDTFLRKINSKDKFIVTVESDNNELKVTPQIAPKINYIKNTPFELKKTLEFDINHIHDSVNHSISASFQDTLSSLTRGKLPFFNQKEKSKIYEKIVDEFILQEQKTYVCSIINKEIDKINSQILTKNQVNDKKENIITKADKAKIFSQIEQSHGIYLGVDFDTLAQPSIKGAVISVKELESKLHILAKEFSDGNSLVRGQIKELCLNTISDYIFSHYYPKISLSKIREDTATLINNIVIEKSKQQPLIFV